MAAEKKEKKWDKLSEKNRATKFSNKLHIFLAVKGYE